MNYETLINQQQKRFRELEQELSDPNLFSDQKRATAIMREHGHLKNTLGLWDKLTQTRTRIHENEELAAGDDAEIAELATLELDELQEQLPKLEQEMKFALLPPDPDEDRDAILEIRAGAGGDEASLFVGELFRMYTRNAENHGWKIEQLDASPSEVGGFKEVVIRISGTQVFRTMKYESGVHRVQRVPTTETQGRIHTSTVTVAVLPEADEVDVQIKPDDLRIEVCRAGGAGGQHVNRTESAVQVFHLPSGIMVRCEDNRSQSQNKERALQILRSRLYELKVREQQEKYSANRRALIGSGDRSEKIRTYNFPQDRVTDHRVNLTTHNLPAVLDGNLEEFTVELQKAEMAERLAEAQGRN